MNYIISLQRVLRCTKPAITAGFHNSCACGAAVKKTTAAGGVMGLGKGKKGKAGKLTTMERKQLDVETDPYKLVNYVCGSNIYVAGEDVAIKADADYPAWLWELNVGRPTSLAELDPGTKLYWQRVRAAAMRRNNKLHSMRRF